MAATSCNSFHAEHLGRCHCECVMVDVGLNDGRTLLHWPVHLAQRMQKLNRSSQAGVRRRLEWCIARNSSCYYGFEANSAFDQGLLALQTSLRGQGVPVRLFTSTAFGIGAEPIDFLVEPFSFGTGAISSTTEPTNILSYRNRFGHWTRNHTTTVASHYRRVRVPSMDAGEFLRAVVVAPSFVGLKLDAEAGEYTLLPHLLLTMPQVVCAIDALAVEWHEAISKRHRGGREHLRWLMRRPVCPTSLFEWH